MLLERKAREGKTFILSPDEFRAGKARYDESNVVMNRQRKQKDEDDLE
jgi:hypothetical protein